MFNQKRMRWNFPNPTNFNCLERFAKLFFFTTTYGIIHTPCVIIPSSLIQPTIREVPSMSKRAQWIHPSSRWKVAWRKWDSVPQSFQNPNARNGTGFLDVEPKIGGLKTTTKWMVKIMVPTLWTNGWFGGFSHYFWKHPYFPSHFPLNGSPFFTVHVGKSSIHSAHLGNVGKESHPGCWWLQFWEGEGRVTQFIICNLGLMFNRNDVKVFLGRWFLPPFNLWNIYVHLLP